MCEEICENIQRNSWNLVLKDNLQRPPLSMPIYFLYLKLRNESCSFWFFILIAIKITAWIIPEACNSIKELRCCCIIMNLHEYRAACLLYTAPLTQYGLAIISNQCVQTSRSYRGKIAGLIDTPGCTDATENSQLPRVESGSLAFTWSTT